MADVEQRVGAAQPARRWCRKPGYERRSHRLQPNIRVEVATSKRADMRHAEEFRDVTIAASGSQPSCCSCARHAAE